jgi:hypothetical protein
MEENTVTTSEEVKEPTVYRVSETSLPWLQGKLDKLNARAKKLGCKPVTITRTGEEMMVVCSNHGYGIDPDCTRPTYEVSPEVYATNLDKYDRVGYRRYFLFTIDFEPIRFSGWTFIGALDHLTGEDADTIVRCVPGQEMPESFRSRGPICDHCGYSRRRHETFVVKHEDGTYKTVGRQCLADFLGHVSPENLANMATWACDIANLFNSDHEGTGSGEVTIFNLSDYLGWVAATIRVDGYFLSRKTAREQDRFATADKASGVMFLKPRTRQDEEEKAKYRPCADDAVTVDASLAWANALTGDSDYESNVRVLARLSVLGHRHFGLAASIVGCYLRDKARKEEQELTRKTTKPSEFVGEIGKRTNFTLTVTTMKTMESDFGVTTLVKFVDADGNRLTWFASKGNPGNDVGGDFINYEIGTTYEVKATVKKHSQHDAYGKETQLNRVTILKVKAEAA